MVLGLCQSLEASVYIGGMGGSRQYLDQHAFETAGVQIKWQDFIHPSYTQHVHPQEFVEKMSVIDLLASYGPKSRSVLEGKVL